MRMSTLYDEVNNLKNCVENIRKEVRDSIRMEEEICIINQRLRELESAQKQFERAYSLWFQFEVSENSISKK